MERKKVIEVFQKWGKGFVENPDEYMGDHDGTLEYSTIQADYFLKLYEELS